MSCHLLSPKPQHRCGRAAVAAQVDWQSTVVQASGASGPRRTTGTERAPQQKHSGSSRRWSRRRHRQVVSPSHFGGRTRGGCRGCVPTAGSTPPPTRPPQHVVPASPPRPPRPAVVGPRALPGERNSVAKENCQRGRKPRSRAGAAARRRHWLRGGVPSGWDLMFSKSPPFS